MDPVTTALYGGFPRAVGSPHQWFVHSEEEFDLFYDTASGQRNVYSSVSYIGQSGGPVCDKIFYDFDTPQKRDGEVVHEEFSNGLSDREKIRIMRDHPDIAQDILGDVLDDARRFVEVSTEDDIPVICVFTGFGLHVHQLYQPEEDPRPEMQSTAYKYVDELGLQTADEAVIGDVQRLARVPNAPRVDTTMDDNNRIVESTPCNLFTIPLLGHELEGLTAHDLVLRARSRRKVEPPTGAMNEDERPEMQFYKDYEYLARGGVSSPEELEEEVASFVDEDVQWYVKRLLQMPCMATHVLRHNPPHDIRQNFAVMLFNIGFTPRRAHNLISKLGWADYDPDETRKQLDNIYRNGYSDMSCKTLMSRGYCVYADDPDECPTEGWSGGKCEW